MRLVLFAFQYYSVKCSFNVASVVKNLRNSIFKILRSSLLKRLKKKSCIFNLYFVFILLHALKSPCIIPTSLRQVLKTQMRWVADYWDDFYQNIYPKMCMCVCQLSDEINLFDLGDCISCFREANHASAPENHRWQSFKNHYSASLTLARDCDTQPCLHL